MNQNGIQRHGASNIFRPGRQYMEVIVRSVNREAGRASVMDRSSGTEVEVASITPDGGLPQPGDVWLMSCELGPWRFKSLIDGIDRPVHTMHQMVMQEVERGHVRWQPEDTIANSWETAQGAYIGERRLFEVIPNGRWVALNGQEIDRHRYRTYFAIVGTTHGVGNGTTTFNVSTMTHPTGATWCVAVE